MPDLEEKFAKVIISQERHARPTEKLTHVIKQRKALVSMPVLEKSWRLAGMPDRKKSPPMF